MNVIEYNVTDLIEIQTFLCRKFIVVDIAKGHFDSTDVHVLNEGDEARIKICDADALLWRRALTDQIQICHYDCCCVKQTYTTLIASAGVKPTSEGVCES